MASMIQIRNVPDNLSKRLKELAAQRGLSLSDFLKQEMERICAKRSWKEMFERIESREPNERFLDAALLVREERDSRDGR